MLKRIHFVVYKW